MGGVAAVVVCIASSIGAVPLAGQTIRTTIDTATVTVGDRITLSVTVEHDASARVVWPDSVDLSPLEVVSATLREPRTAAGRTTSTADFSLAAFELGELEIPAFDVTVEQADGSTATLRTDRFGVEVVSVGTDEGGDIREIRGPVTIPVSVLRVGLIALLFMLLGAGANALLRRLRRRPDRDDGPSVGPPPRPAHEVALEALERLAASTMLERGQVKEYHIQLSDILRRYVEERFHVHALEMTTSEILVGLRRVGVEGSFADGLREVLDRCDMVKFAKVRPEPGLSRELVELARDLVESSAAPAAPAGTGEPPAGSAPEEATPAKEGTGVAVGIDEGARRDARPVVGEPAMRSLEPEGSD